MNTPPLNMPMAPLTGEIQEIPGIINNLESDYKDLYNDFDDNDDIIIMNILGRCRASVTQYLSYVCASCTTGGIKSSRTRWGIF